MALGATSKSISLGSIKENVGVGTSLLMHFGSAK
jgi:hypothetical protein